MNGFLPPFVELFEWIGMNIFLRQGAELVFFADIGDIV